MITNLNFLVPKSLYPKVIDLWYILKYKLNYESLNYQRCTPSGCSDIGIQKEGFIDHSATISKYKISASFVTLQPTFCLKGLISF